jgi:hypothetical protein
LSRAYFTLTPAPAAVGDPVAKVGGQPNWLAEPQWPLSRDLGTPMWFIGQFAVEGGLAYVFLSEATEAIDYAAEPDGGENAVIIQPYGRLPLLQRSYLEIPSPVAVVTQAQGPTVGPDHLLIEVTLGQAGQGALQFLGDEPQWLQGDELPEAGYRLIAQLDSQRLPFDVDFGDAGIGDVFISSDGREGRFLWQCH